MAAAHVCWLMSARLSSTSAFSSLASHAAKRLAERIERAHDPAPELGVNFVGWEKSSARTRRAVSAGELLSLGGASSATCGAPLCAVVLAHAHVRGSALAVA